MQLPPIRFEFGVGEGLGGLAQQIYDYLEQLPPEEAGGPAPGVKLHLAAAIDDAVRALHVREPAAGDVPPSRYSKRVEEGGASVNVVVLKHY